MRELQELLAKNGFNPGTIDGTYGPATRRAIEDFERSRGRDLTGEATPALLAELRALVPAEMRESERIRTVETKRALPPPGAVLSAPPLPQGGVVLDPDRLYEQVSDAVWITVAAPSFADLDTLTDISQGSAVAVAPDRLLTNCHLFSGRNVIAILQGEAVDTAQLIAADFDSDRCVLEPETFALRPVRGTRLYSDLRVGERVFTIGSPSGLERSFGEGLISGLRVHDGIFFVQTTAPISPGSSGGGLFDGRGNLIGITTFLVTTGQQLNFAIAVESFWKENEDPTVLSKLPPMGCGNPEMAKNADGSITLLVYSPSGSPAGAAIPPDIHADLALRGVNLALVELNAGTCAIWALITGHPDQVVGGDAVLAGVADDARPLFRGGDKLVIDIAAASEPRYVSVDYIVHTGDVWHLYPGAGDSGHLPAGQSLRLGDGSDSPAWEIGAPFGKDLVVVTLSSIPFGADQQPIAESADAYYTRLQERLQAPAVNVFARVIETGPP